MGMDWCLNDRTIEGQQENLKFAESQLISLNERLSAAYREYCSCRGIQPPAYYPNEHHSRFQEEDPIAKELLSAIAGWNEARLRCVVTPLEELGTPVVGIDEEADEYAKGIYQQMRINWREAENEGTTDSQDSSRIRRLLDKYPNVEDYVGSMKGVPVTALTKNKEGFAKYSSFVTGPESFRGQDVTNIPWLDEETRNEGY